MTKASIWTDGAVVGLAGKPGRAGWGAVVRVGNLRRETCGGLTQGTVFRMELTAAIEALKALETPCEVDLHSDSLRLVRTMRIGLPWLWRENGYAKPDGGTTAEADLWEKLLKECDRHKDVRFFKVRAHSGDDMNYLADKLARLGRDRVLIGERGTLTAVSILKNGRWVPAEGEVA